MTQQLANNKEPRRKTITKKTHLEITVWGQRSTFYHSFKECFRKREIKNVTETKTHKKTPTKPMPTTHNKHILKNQNTTTFKKAPKPTKIQHSNLKVLLLELHYKILIHFKTSQNFFRWIVCWFVSVLQATHPSYIQGHYRRINRNRGHKVFHW